MRSAQPRPWATVLELVCTIDDALALMALFEYRDGLFANDTPIDALDTGTGVAVLSDRGLAAFLAEHLEAIEADGWTYTDLYRPTRGIDPSQDHIDAFVARASSAGVVLTHRHEVAR